MYDENLAELVRTLEAEGRWIDRGRWVQLPWSSGPADLPTRREIAEKCRLLRSREERHGAHARAPRGGRTT